MHYKDQLVLTGKLNDVGDAVRINVPKSYRLGLETWGSRQINKWLVLQGNLTISNNQLKNYTDYIPKYDVNFDFSGYDTLNLKNTQISFSPRLTAYGGVRVLPIKNFEINLNNKVVSKQYLDNTNSEQKKLNGYFVQDLLFRYSIHKKIIKTAELVLQVNNVWNKKYEANGYSFSYVYDTSLVKENFYYPMAGTNILLALKIGL
jgi:iron complex outermembrane receptor protein